MRHHGRIDQRARGHQQRLAFGQLEARVLERKDGLAKGLALFRVGQGLLHGQLHGGNACHGNDQALLRQLLHELDETHAFLPTQQVGGRHHHVVKEQLRGVLRIHAQLVEVATPAEALYPISLDHHQRHALRALVLVGLADHDDEVGQLAVGDEGLATVDAVALTFLDGRGAHALQVRARAGLGHGNGANQLARGQAR